MSNGVARNDDGFGPRCRADLGACTDGRRSQPTLLELSSICLKTTSMRLEKCLIRRDFGRRLVLVSISKRRISKSIGCGWSAQVGRAVRPPSFTTPSIGPSSIERPSPKYLVQNGRRDWR
jgi:hypothetical protein